MRLHILGICGTFMAGIAQLAKQSGYEVSGSDENVYPPMSDLLAAQGIEVRSGYQPEALDPELNAVIVGNVIRRGNPSIEHILNEQIPYISGPQWLYENILKSKWVLAVAGTHGKTTTASLLTWILECAGKNPGFLIGGVPENFGFSARLTQSEFFVIEADEYDSAFFDKRSKFLHYHPKTLVLNNLEFDHADIFPDLDAIKQQFHFLVRTIPQNGLIIRNDNDDHLKAVLGKGCWTPVVTFGNKQSQWQANLLEADGSHFKIYHDQQEMAEVQWSLIGEHNVLNALAAVAAAYHVGVSISDAANALSTFKNVKRRLEVKAKLNDIVIYDDFAHHPTAIATTLSGLRKKIGAARILAVLEFGSYTMRTGVHKEALASALKDANAIFCKKPAEPIWDLDNIMHQFKQPTFVSDNVDDLVEQIKAAATSGDHIVIMSNSSFGGIHHKLVDAMM